jgi:TetR/AcrR family transcriptional regulator, tetracycline repressor protein
MRALATRLAVVPGAVYRHVRNKEELQDLVLDAVLGEVDRQVESSDAWTEQVTTLAQRLRTILEDHRGIAGLLKTRAPLTPHSLALSEAFLAALTAADLPPDRTALAFHLVYDFTLGFALSDHGSPSEQRVRDETTRTQLHAFLRSLPADRFPVLTTLGERVWADDRDQRFTANLATLITGIQACAAPPRRRAPRAAGGVGE